MKRLSKADERLCNCLITCKTKEKSLRNLIMKNVQVIKSVIKESHNFLSCNVKVEFLWICFKKNVKNVFFLNRYNNKNIFFAIRNAGWCVINCLAELSCSFESISVELIEA